MQASRQCDFERCGWFESARLAAWLAPVQAEVRDREALSAQYSLQRWAFGPTWRHGSRAGWAVWSQYWHCLRPAWGQLPYCGVTTVLSNAALMAWSCHGIRPD